MRFGFVDQVIDYIFSNISIFDKFRNIVHNNYKNEKKNISKNFKNNKKTLDFGCGIGQFSTMFNPDKYYGVDTDNKYIKFCKNNYKGKFSKIKESPPYKFSKNYFDQIIVSAVIHHLEDKKLASISKEFKRILKNNGEVMIIDHFTKENQANLFCKFLIYLDRGKYFRNPKKALNLFSKDFNIKKIQIFKNGIYKDYMLILRKL